MIRFTSWLLLVLWMCHCLACAQAVPYVPAATETEHDGNDLGAMERSFSFTPTQIPGALNLFPTPFAGITGVQNDFDRPAKKSFALELGPKLLEVRGSYWERRREEPVQLGALSAPGESRWGSYYDLLATSSQFDGKLVGEAEAAYSTLGLSTSNNQEPMMTRLGVHGRWGKTGYGMFLRSSGRGFMAPDGAAIEHDRDESQVWVEYDFGIFRMRGAAGEMWEKNSTTSDLTLTRSAATSFYVNKANWSATLSTTYSLMGQGEDATRKGIGFTNGFSLAYRPTPLLTLEPNLAYKQEWAPVTRLKTDIPSAGFALTYKQSRDLQLIGRTSYTRELSGDPLRNASLVNAAAGLNWKLGRSSLGEQSLSLQLEYRNELRAALPSDLQSNLTGTVQFKILGF